MTSSVEVIRVTAIVIGIFFSIIFIGYMALSASEARKLTSPRAPKRVVGALSILIGLLLVFSWIYFRAVALPQVWYQNLTMSFHIITELFSALALVIAGIALFKDWPRGPALFMLANAYLLFTSMLTFAIYGNVSQAEFLNPISNLLVLVAVYLVGLVYAWEHFVFRLDTGTQPEDKKKAA